MWWLKPIIPILRKEAGGSWVQGQPGLCRSRSELKSKTLSQIHTQNKANLKKLGYGSVVEHLFIMYTVLYSVLPTTKTTYKTKPKNGQLSPLNTKSQGEWRDARWLKELDALANDPGLVLNIHIWQLTTVSNSNELVWCHLLVWVGTWTHAVHIQTSRHTHGTHIHINKNKKH